MDVVPSSSLLAKLDSVAEHRQHFASLFQHIAQTQLSELPTQGPIVEIGAGDGQLTKCMPDVLHERLLLTEPDEDALERLRQRFGGVDCARAGAEDLPVAAGSVAAVVGCCVLDVVDDLDAVIGEVHRSLRTNGVFLHLLDMSTDLSLLIDEVVTMSSLCLLPNVFTDPMAAPWPEDLMVAPREQLVLVAGALSNETDRALVGDYLAAFERSTFDAIEVFNALHESTVGRRRFFEAFRMAMSSADEGQRQAFAEFAGRPLSSSRVFNDRVLHAMGDRFRVEVATIVRRRESLPVVDGEPVARRSIVGYTQSGRVTSPEDESSARRTSHAPHELGVHVLRAVKI
ncbi:MAG: class I SAM-dependent methyltransferase [Myxococcota bacterium]